MPRIQNPLGWPATKLYPSWQWTIACTHDETQSNTSILEGLWFFCLSLFLMNKLRKISWNFKGTQCTHRQHQNNTYIFGPNIYTLLFSRPACFQPLPNKDNSTVWGPPLIIPKIHLKICGINKSINGHSRSRQSIPSTHNGKQFTTTKMPPSLI